GLQARMPDRRRYGADEDRVSAPLPEAPPAHPARPSDRLSAALCPLRGAHRAADEPEEPGAAAGGPRGTLVRAQRPSQIAALVQPPLSRGVVRDRARGRA